MSSNFGGFERRPTALRCVKVEMVICSLLDCKSFAVVELGSICSMIPIAARFCCQSDIRENTYLPCECASWLGWERVCGFSYHENPGLTNLYGLLCFDVLRVNELALGIANPSPGAFGGVVHFGSSRWISLSTIFLLA